jgi:hypothetical protein
MTEKDYAELSSSEKQKEDWMNAKWRPMMGWVYMLTCITDFIVFPILWSIVQAAFKQPITAWQPITLQGAGLFHLAMGAIIGVAAFGRTQEKLAGTHNGNMQPTSYNTPYTMPQPTRPQPVSQGFNGTSATDFTQPQVKVGYGGKLAPEQPQYPLI